MGKKQSFLSQHEITSYGKPIRHLNSIISDPDEEQNYLVVPVTTFHKEISSPNSEQNVNTCELNNSDHPFLGHQSWVCFSKSKQMSYAEVFNGLRQGLLVPKTDISVDTLKNIQEHAKTSQYLPEKLKHFEDYF
ncbi:hypothetical protein ACYULU_07610 [Breznakiellaceae bacterium SP9]